MKICLTFKTPDVVDYVVRDNASVHPEHTEEEADALWELESKIRTACDKFIRAGEYVTIEIDTETGEARVQEAT